LGHAYVGSEHLLLGLARERRGVAAHALKHVGLEAQDIHAQIAHLVGVGTPGGLPSQGLTPRCRHILELAVSEAARLGKTTVDTEHLLLGILQEGEGVAARVLTASGVDAKRMYSEVLAALGGGNSAPIPPPGGRNKNEKEFSDTKLLDQFCRDMTRMAALGKLDPVIGREEETRRMIQILSRRTKNNPVLIGEPGVGKTAVVEGLARRIASGQVPLELRNKRIFSLDLSSMVAGTKYRGEFEERVKNALVEAKRAGDIILFIDELHTIVGAGSAEGAIDAANIIKPALSRGELQVIGATTYEEYRRYIEKDGALARRFQVITVREPNRETTVDILKGLRERYEAHHRLRISDEAILAAVTLSQRYLPSRFLPDKAVDLIDEAASYVRMERQKIPPDLKILEERVNRAAMDKETAIQGQNFEVAARLRDAEADFRRQLEERLLSLTDGASPPEVMGEDIATVISLQTGIPITAITEQESDRLIRLEDVLHRRLVGQNEAASAVARAIRRSRTGLKNPNRPTGAFLFLGPTGVGKTELCCTLAEALFGTAEALLRFDMSEYMERHTVARLIGAPPGYVGYEEGGQLTERVRKQPYSVVLFDEIEKAHEDIWGILLQIMEDGQLTDAQGRKADFRNTVIVLTSNLGAKRITSNAPCLGFASGGSGQEPEQMKRLVLDDLKKTFRPEFLNRLDETIVFRRLERPELSEITRRMLQQVEQRLTAMGIGLTISEDAVELLAQKGYDPLYGARPLRRLITAEVEDPAAELILKKELTAGKVYFITVQSGALCHSCIKA
jgi:ATP-dependent Clp protease ATP-binding subunit ClpC